MYKDKFLKNLVDIKNSLNFNKEQMDINETGKCKMKHNFN